MLLFLPGTEVEGLHLPVSVFVSARRVFDEMSGADRAAEEGLDGEAVGVGVEVADEVVPGEVFRGGGAVRGVWERADLLGEVEVEAVVGALPPQGSHAVVALQDDARHPAPR